MNVRSDLPRVEGVTPGVDKGSVRVWDPIVRLFHWTVVAGCAVNLLLENGGKVHRVVGYVVATAVGVRIVWGFVSHGHARFSAFTPRPAMLGKYLRQLFANREPRYIGHNPAGSIMILALIGLLIAVSITGWMLGLDRYFGNETLGAIHEACAMTILPLVGMHVLAAVFESFRHRENLVKSMFTGRKRKAAGSDVNDAIDTR